MVLKASSSIMERARFVGLGPHTDFDNGNVCLCTMIKQHITQTSNPAKFKNNTPSVSAL